MKLHRSLRLYASLAMFLAPCVMAADTSIDPAAYPSEALKLADTLTPDLAASLKTCNVEAARSVHKRASEFLYKKWNWGANYEQLKPYRACFQMLSDIAAATQLVTNKSLNTPPRMVAGLYDANYASCRRLADPSFQSTEVSGNMKWPDRFGAEPSKRPCG